MNVFDQIYGQNLWNGVESRSGPGSGTIATAGLGDTLRVVVSITEADSVLDVACGDGFWMPELPGYLGVDISRTAIDLARINHPDRAYMVADMRRWDSGHYGLIICRDAMQHLSLADGAALLEHILNTGAEWLLASTYVGGENIDIATGLDANGITFYSPDLTAPPFDLGHPRAMFPDGYDYHVPGAIRDVRKMLGLWNLWS